MNELERASQRRRENDLRRTREALERTMDQRMRTTFIGALASIERHLAPLFGALPGWAEAFRRCREEILDNGNRQSRELLADLDRYEVGAKKAFFYPPMRTTEEGNGNQESRQGQARRY
jgi:hypothetical protein